MWLMTPFGFFSIVCATGKGGKPHPGLRMVRARNRAHLQALRARHPGLPPIKTSERTDYPYRIIVAREQVAVIMLALADDLDYTNFKAEAKVVSPNDDGYIDFLHTVWGNGLRLTPPMGTGVKRGFFGMAPAPAADPYVSVWDRPDELPRAGSV